MIAAVNTLTLALGVGAACRVVGVPHGATGRSKETCRQLLNVLAGETFCAEEGDAV